MYLAFTVEVVETEQEFATDDGYLILVERTGFELDESQNTYLLEEGESLTKSRHEPPPRYSMTIHSLWPLRKLALY